MLILHGLHPYHWAAAGAGVIESARTSIAAHAEHLLVCGTGNLAPFVALAHASARPIKQVSVWGRNPEKAEHTAEAIRVKRPELEVRVAPDLEVAVRAADVVSCATGSHEPLVLPRSNAGLKMLQHEHFLRTCFGSIEMPPCAASPSRLLGRGKTST